MIAPPLFSRGATPVADLLARVTAPMLILHSRHHGVLPCEHCRMLAATLPNAKFLTLEGDNRVVLHDEPHGID
jgi:pimeloyl-ACP methyl ester carboxylesterase